MDITTAMSVTGKHYHFATGKSSKNRGKFYLCPNKTTNTADGCCIYPAYLGAEGKELIYDTRHDLVLFGLLSNDDNLTLEQEKEALDSPFILGLASYGPQGGSASTQRSDRATVVFP
jgi:hypothetical protein